MLSAPVARRQTVVVFCGHMTDAPGRAEARFPGALADPAAALFERTLGALNAAVLVCSAARGADLLALEVAARAGVERHILLPFAADAFIGCSIEPDPGGQWRARFRDAVAAATTLQVLGSHAGAARGVDFELVNRAAIGTALLLADATGRTPLVLGYWDGRGGDGPGGTAAMLAAASARGLATQVLDAEALRRGIAARRLTVAAADARAVSEPGIVHLCAPLPLRAGAPAALRCFETAAAAREHARALAPRQPCLLDAAVLLDAQDLRRWTARRALVAPPGPARPGASLQATPLHQALARFEGLAPLAVPR